MACVVRKHQFNQHAGRPYLQPDVIIGCETKLTDDVRSYEVLLEQYVTNSYRKVRTANGGVVIISFRDGNVTNQVEFNADAEQV